MRATSYIEILKSVLFLLVIHLTYSLHGQQPSISYLTADHFLMNDAEKRIPHYDFEMDSTGYVYCAGPGGLIRFNGHNMVNLNRQPWVYTAFYKDAHGRLWTRGYKRGLAMVTQDSLVQYEHNEVIKPFWRKTLNEAYMDTTGTMHLGVLSYGYVTVSANGEISDQVTKTLSDIHGFVVTQLPDGKLFHYSVYQGPREQYSIFYQNTDGSFHKLAEVEDTISLYESYLVSHDDQTWMLSNGNHTIIHASKDSLIQMRQFPFNIIKLFLDSRKDLWMGTLDDGVYRAPGGDFERTEQMLDAKWGGVHAEDQSGGLWVSSQQAGFAYITNPDMLRYSDDIGNAPTRKTVLMATDRDRIYLSDGDSAMVIIHGEQIEHIVYPPELIYSPQTHAKSRGVSHYYADTINNRLCVASTEHLAEWDGERWKVHALGADTLLGGKIVELLSLDESHMIGATDREVLYLENGRITETHPVSSTTGLIRNLVMDVHGGIWLGTVKGVWRWQNGEVTRPSLSPEFPELTEELAFYTRSFKDAIWVRTSDQGLFHIKNGKVTRLRNQEGKSIKLGECVPSNAFGGSLWGTEHLTDSYHLYCLIPSGDSVIVERYYFDDLAFSYGYYPGQFTVVGDTLFMRTAGGIFRKSIHQLKKHGPIPQTRIVSVSANHQVMNQAALHGLSHEQNVITLAFEPINFRIVKPTFRCRLIGFETDWATPTYNEIQFTNLAPGEYRFEVQAKILDEPWGPVDTVSFHIQTPYWQTWWFRTLSIIAFAALTGSVFLLWYRRQQKNANLIIEKLRAEQRALRAQMDPHFVYNALNSAQKLLLLNRTDDYQMFMSQLAKLMRSGLEHSRLEFIPVEHELEFLNNYLSIETQRFPERFAYQIHIENEVEEQMDGLSIPPLMIQPICENAIKHAYNGEPVNIDVRVGFHEEETLSVSVTDNGIGYRNRQAKKRNGTASHGLNILLGRVELLRKQGFNASFQIFPMSQQNETGTRVELNLPVV